jgi:hypothetical protein
MFTVMLYWPVHACAAGGVVVVTLKFAVAFLAEDMATVQAPVPALAQSPLQPTNIDPGLAEAVSSTAVPLANEAEHVAPQLMPAGEEVTAPLPVPERATVSVCALGPWAWKLAVTLRDADIVTVQAPVPEQSPPQPEKVDPAPGEAVSATTVPLANEAEHVDPQLIPAGEDDTEPLPVPLRLTARLFVVESAAGRSLPNGCWPIGRLREAPLIV